MIYTRKIHPVVKIHEKMQKLKTSVSAVPTHLRPVGRPLDNTSADIWGASSSLMELQWSVKREFEAWSADGETSQQETKEIADCFGRFGADLHRLCQGQANTNHKITNKLLKDIIGAAYEMARAVDQLEKAVAADRILVVRQHTDYPKQFLKIKEAMTRLNPDAAMQLRGQEVDYLCEWPGVNLSDSHEVESMAKLIMLDKQEHQIFELRCRSKTPGRHLKLMMWYPEFPPEEALFTNAQLFKRPEKIYVAAIKPTWRIVWVFDRETEGW